MCGRLLADLGAEVIKVEPPGGDPGRCRGPFVRDSTDPELGLRWWFLNRGKRSVVLDGEEDGFARLVRSADVVIESSGDVDPTALLAANPRQVVTSISSFGLDGPYAGFKGPDLIVGAMGGPVWLTGDADRAPVRISVPQYDLHASAEAAVHTLIALYHASCTGEGQHVDVSAQLCAIRTLMNATAYPYLEGRELKRGGRVRASSDFRFRIVFRCKDGHVALLLGGGTRRGALLNKLLFDWMDDQGMCPEWLRDLDWAATEWTELARAGDDLFDRVSDAVEHFLLTQSKEDLYEGAIERRLLLAPVCTVEDIRRDPQLAARGYFTDVDHGDLGRVAYLGPWAKLSATPLVDTPRAPRIGEHQSLLRQAVLQTATDRGPDRGRDRSRPTEKDVFGGLKVWDMSWVGVGPMTARYLADYGATVVRLDSTKRPDILRLGPPFKDGEPGINRSQFYADFNASKLGIGIDMENPLGREVAIRLVEWADVLLESFTPKTMAAWGMSYAELNEVKPSLVMLSTCMQGQTGPRAHYRGFGNVMAALAGFYEVTGWRDRDPVPVFGAYTDFICQRFCATALVAALEHRRSTGEGQHIDVSQYEAAIQFLGTEFLDFEVNGRVVTREGNRDPWACPHNVYACVGDERWIAIAVTSDDEWAALRRAMGNPAWAADPGLSTLEGRKAREDEIDAHLAAWTRTQDRDALWRVLQPEVAAGPVLNQTELHEDPQIVHRGYFETLEHSVMGAVPYDGLQARLSRTPARLRKAAPCVGEDTFTILHEILGMSEDEIGDLIAKEAVEIT